MSPAFSKSSCGVRVSKYCRQFPCRQRPYNTIETGKVLEMKQRTINNNTLLKIKVQNKGHSGVSWSNQKKKCI